MPGQDGSGDRVDTVQVPLNVADASTILERVTFEEILLALGWDRPVHGRARCPICQNENKSALSVVEAKGVFYCHRGGHGGGKADLVAAVLSCERREAISWIADLAGLSYGMSREQWKAWKKIQDKQRQVRAWTARMVSIFRDLAGSYRTVEPLNLVRADRYTRIADELDLSWSGEELVRWYDQRRNLKKNITGDAWDRLSKIQAERKKKAVALVEASRAEWLLLGACATPAEWEESLREYESRHRAGQAKRDTRDTRGGSRAGEHNKQPAA